MMMLVSVLVGFVAALLAPWIYGRVGKNTGWLLAIVPAGITAWYLQYLPRIADGEIIRESTPWVPGFDVHLSFVLDGLSIFFVLLVAGIGTFIFIYASGYVGRHAQAGRFYLYIVSFMASMIGLVLADNIITVYVFFELTSFTSFFLIAFNHEAPSSRRAGWQSLLVTNVGGLALLASVILMANIAGSMEISEILRQPEALQASPLYLPILLCLLAAVFTKSAQYPFYFWLPNAMEAPTPVSAYLHSATMVKAGVYLLARFSPALSGTTEWLWLVTGFGAFTMVVTAWLSLGYTDLKRILAYSTVMALGLLTMLLGVGGEAAIVACVVFIVVHALYKASLFMVAGAIDHEAGTRNVADLRGLRKAMPVTFAAAIIAGLSMAGFPPFIGFIGKEIVYEAALGQETIFGLLVGISVLANVAIVGAAAVVAIKPFLGEASPAALSAHRAPISLWLGPVVLAGIGLVFGLVPSLVDKNIIAPAAATILGAPDVRVYLSLWHGINVPLLLSGVTVAVGVGLYLAWEKIRVSGGMGWLRRWLAEAPENGYDHSLNGMMWFAKAQTNFIQTGVLRYSMGIVFAVAGLLILGTVLIRVGLPAVDLATFGEIRAYEWILSATIILSAFGAVLTPSRLGAVLILGVSGLSIALIYISFGAPDLAMTQFLVETLTVIIFVLIVIKLPRYVRLKSSSRGRVRDIAIASVTGLAVTLVMLAILRRPFSSTMAEYYAAASYPEAYGRNIVNVILVDFRAFDTFGEIIVLAVAGLGIFSLIWLTIGKDRADVQAGDEDVKHSAEVTDR